MVEKNTTLATVDVGFSSLVISQCFEFELWLYQHNLVGAYLRHRKKPELSSVDCC